MEVGSPFIPGSGSESLLSSVMDELKRSTKPTPPHITKGDHKPPLEESNSANNPVIGKDQNGIAEYSAYIRVVDAPEDNHEDGQSVTSLEKSPNASKWSKCKYPPIKPKRRKKPGNGTKDGAADSSSVASDIHNLLESAFSHTDEQSLKMSDDSECAVFSPQDTPVRTRSVPYKIELTDKSSETRRNHHGSSIHSDITDSKFSVDMRSFHSRSFDSLNDPRYETVSMFSQLSDEDPTGDWNDEGRSEYGDTISLASADGQLDGKPNRKRIDPKARAKQLKKQAAVGKEKVGAFLDAAASNATSRIKKFRRPSIKFAAGKSRFQNLGRKYAKICV